MHTYNRFYRKRRKSTHELLDTADTGSQERSRTSGRDFPQPPGRENRFRGLFDAEEPETDIDVTTSKMPTDAVFSYLSAIGPIRVLNHDEEFALAKRIAEGEAQIATETLCSLLALHSVLAMGQKVISGTVHAREIVDGSDETSVNPTIDDKILQSRFRSRLTKIRYLARRHERITKQCDNAISPIKRKKLDQ